MNDRPAFYYCSDSAFFKESRQISGKAVKLVVILPTPFRLDLPDNSSLVFVKVARIQSSFKAFKIKSRPCSLYCNDNAASRPGSLILPHVFRRISIIFSSVVLAISSSYWY